MFTEEKKTTYYDLKEKAALKDLDITSMHFERTRRVFGKLVSDVKDEKCCSVVFYTRCWL